MSRLTYRDAAVQVLHHLAGEASSPVRADTAAAMHVLAELGARTDGGPAAKVGDTVTSEAAALALPLATVLVPVSGQGRGLVMRGWVAWAAGLGMYPATVHELPETTKPKSEAPTYRTGDPDPTPAEGPYCMAWNDSGVVHCTWRPGHPGDHVGGDGRKVCAVWPQGGAS